MCVCTIITCSLSLNKTKAIINNNNDNNSIIKNIWMTLFHK